MSTTLTIHGREYFCEEYGPFLLASDAPFDPAQIDEGDQDVWLRLGFILNPRDFGNDLGRVRRCINAFMLMEQGSIGTDFTVTALSVAKHFVNADGPCFVSLNESLESHN